MKTNLSATKSRWLDNRLQKNNLGS